MAPRAFTPRAFGSLAALACARPDKLATSLPRFTPPVNLRGISYGGGLEGIHNSVHDWFIPNPKEPSDWHWQNHATMNTVPLASADPMFWMHHANVDRIWAIWQYNNPGKNPDLPGTLNKYGRPANIMDPWTHHTEVDTRDIIGLGYTYV